MNIYISIWVAGFKPLDGRCSMSLWYYDNSNTDPPPPLKIDLGQYGVGTPPLHGCRKVQVLLCSSTTLYSLVSLLWTATCLVRPLYEVNLLGNSMDFMFILSLLCKATCCLRQNFVENVSDRSKQVLLYLIAGKLGTPQTSWCNHL